MKIHTAMGECLQSNQGKRSDDRSTTTSPSHCSGRSSANRNGSRIQLSPCMCDRTLSRLLATFGCSNHRTISDTQPGRERPRNRPWGQGQGSRGGVAHVPAALCDILRGGKNRRRFSVNPRGSLSANSHSVFGCAHGPGSASPHDRFDLRSGTPLRRGVMDALAPSPLPSPLSDLARDGVLPQEGGRRPP